MSVITISRQMGSLGCDVAEAIARCLNYRVVWREVINEAASRAGAPEMALAQIDELDLLGLRPSHDERKAYQQAVREIMHELVREGNVVIVGRAGQMILRDVENVMHVKIYAPFGLRVARVAEKHNLPLDAARTQVEKSDQSRARYLQRYYKARWDSPELYDLMINTAHLSVESAALVVCQSLARGDIPQPIQPVTPTLDD